MKRLSATSFFLFAIFFLLCSSCKFDKTTKQKKSKYVLELENTAYQKLNQREYDSAIFYARKMLNLALAENSVISIKAAYSRLSLNFKSNKQYDSAIFYSEKLFNISEQTKDTINMAKACYKKGAYYKEIDSLELAYMNLATSKNLSLKMNDKTNAGKRLLEIANIQKTQGNFGASQLSALDGLDLLENTKEFYSLSGLYYILAVVSKETGNNDMALKRLDQAMELIKNPSVEEKQKNKNLIIFNNTKANVYKELEEYDTAIHIYEDLLSNENIKPNKIETARIMGNLAYTLFLKEGFNTRSDSLLKRSLDIYQAQERISELFSINLKLSELYIEINEDLAIAYVNKSLEYAEKLENLSSIHEALGIKIQITKDGDDIKRYLALAEDLRIRREDLSSLYANERYDLNKAENKIIIAQNKATKFKNQLLALIIVLIVLLVLTFFIYQKIKRRHKIEKLKTVHVTEARISSKVHDELANDLYKLISQLETTNPEKEVVLDKLDVIYNQARDISKQIQGVETGDGFSDELSNLFRSYQSEEVNVLLKRYNTDIWNGISSHIKITIYRVLQELLTNMKKHSNATLVVVSIEKKQKQLFIQYIDNGKGFAEEISKNGLQNAENRIHAIKGKLTFDTKLNNGCKFSINVPV